MPSGERDVSPRFTGMDSPYEASEDAELTLETELARPEDLAERVLAYLKAEGHVP